MTLDQAFAFAIILGTMGLLIWGLWIARNSKDGFGAMLAVGVVGLLFWPVVINVAMVLGLAPVIGVPFPLLSYGGSALLASLIGLGRFDSALLAAVIAVIGGVAGAMLAMRFFDALVIAASAYGGATLIVLGARMLLPIASEPTALSAIPAIIAIVLAILGMRFQLQHMDEWRPAQFSGHHHAAEAGGRKK